jgi:hypothetical protein
MTMFSTDETNETKKIAATPNDRADLLTRAFLAGWDAACPGASNADLRALALREFLGNDLAACRAGTRILPAAPAAGSWIGRTERGRQVVGDTYGEVIGRLAELRNLQVCDLGIRRLWRGRSKEERQILETLVYETRAERDADVLGESKTGWFARIWREPARSAERPAEGALASEVRPKDLEGVLDASDALSSVIRAWLLDGAAPTPDELSLFRELSLLKRSINHQEGAHADR